MQPKSNNLDYLIDKTFRNINGLIVLSFQNGTNVPMRDSFDKYYMPFSTNQRLSTLSKVLMH